MTKRKLGIFETAQTISGEYLPFNAVAVISLTNAPKPEIVQRSLKALQARHPLLQMRIAKKKSQYFFVPEGTPEIPLDVLRRQDPGHWKSVCEEELNTKFDIENGPLLRCRYLYADGHTDEAEVVISCHHAIIDAASIERLFHELLSLCDTFRRGEIPQDTSPLPLLLPEEDYFPPRFKGLSGKIRILRFMGKQMGEELAYRRNMRGKRKPPIQPASRCRILPVQLSLDDTAHLIRRSRQRKVTLNSCLSAAMILSVVRNLYDDQSLPVRYFIFADLRPYLKPPVSRDNLGSYHSMIRLCVPVEKDQDFWDLVLRINRQVYTASKQGEKFIQPLLSPMMMRMFIRSQKIRMGTTALSYPGFFGIESSYGETKVDAVYGFVSNFPIGPEFSATARIFDNRIWLDCLFMDGDMDEAKARAIAEEMMTTLRSPAGR